jgi:tetratricopeptide (TPR) repeat protein
MHPFQNDNNNNSKLQELVAQYQLLKNGQSHDFLDEEAFEQIVDFFSDKDDMLEAQTAVTIGLQQFPYSAELMFKKADMLIANRKFNTALRILEEASIYDTNNISLYILKIDALLGLEKLNNAIEVFESSLTKFEGEEKVELLFEIADVFDDYEHFDRIFDCLRAILEVQPTNDEALYKICFWADFTGRLEESIRIHLNIIDNYPYNEIAWFNLAAAYQSLKLYEKAIDAYLYATAIDEKFDFAYRNLGDAYLRLKQYNNAIEALQKVLELGRPEDVIYEAIAHCYHKLGNTMQARVNYKKALAFNDNDATIHYKVATTYIADRKWQKAIYHLEVALRFNKNSKAFNLAMGECKMQLLQYQEALHFFGNVIKNKPSNVAGWQYFLLCLIETEEFEAALVNCKNALIATNYKPILIYYYSAILIMNGKSKEGLLQLENAMNVAPKLVRKFLEIVPNILQYHQVVDIIAKHKKRSKK